MAQHHVDKYQFAARFEGEVVRWSLTIETDDGKTHTISLRDGEEIPILLDLLRKDSSLLYEPSTRTLTTGMNNPGEDD